MPAKDPLSVVYQGSPSRGAATILGDTDASAIVRQGVADLMTAEKVKSKKDEAEAAKYDIETNPFEPYTWQVSQYEEKYYDDIAKVMADNKGEVPPEKKREFMRRKRELYHLDDMQQRLKTQFNDAYKALNTYPERYNVTESLLNLDKMNDPTKHWTSEEKEDVGGDLTKWFMKYGPERLLVPAEPVIEPPEPFDEQAFIGKENTNLNNNLNSGTFYKDAEGRMINITGQGLKGEAAKDYAERTYNKYPDYKAYIDEQFRLNPQGKKDVIDYVRETRYTDWEREPSMSPGAAPAKGGGYGWVDEEGNPIITESTSPVFDTDKNATIQRYAASTLNFGDIGFSQTYTGKDALNISLPSSARTTDGAELNVKGQIVPFIPTAIKHHPRATENIYVASSTKKGRILIPQSQTKSVVDTGGKRYITDNKGNQYVVSDTYKKGNVIDSTDYKKYKTEITGAVSFDNPTVYGTVKVSKPKEKGEGFIYKSQSIEVPFNDIYSTMATKMESAGFGKDFIQGVSDKLNAGEETDYGTHNGLPVQKDDRGYYVIEGNKRINLE